MRLRHATTAQDDASEALASSFIQSQLESSSTNANANANGREVDEFVNEFKALRKAYHKRVIWGDKWASGQVTWRDDESF
jgi:ESCRT-I complex subunit VPS37